MLFGVLTVSLGLTVLLVLMPSGGPDATSLREKQEARRIIQKEYFGGEGAVRLDPYQRWLREAYQAHLRGDPKREEGASIESPQLAPGRAVVVRPMADRQSGQRPATPATD